MVANGAHERRLFADNDMAAVNAFPDGVALFGEYEPVFDIL